MADTPEEAPKVDYIGVGMGEGDAPPDPPLAVTNW